MTTVAPDTVFRRPAAVSLRMTGRLVALLDGIAVVAAGFALYSHYVGSSEATLMPYLAAIGFNAYLIVQSSCNAGRYRFATLISQRRQLLPVVLTSVKCMIVSIAFAFALGLLDVYSKTWAVLWLTATIALPWLIRLITLRAMRVLAKAGYLVRTIMVYGTGEQVIRLLRHIREIDEPWNRIVGVFDDRASDVQHVEGYPLLGNSDKLVELAREYQAEDILVGLPWDCYERTTAILEKLRVLPANIRLAPALIGMAYPNARANFQYRVPMLNVFEQPLSGWSALGKSVFDRLVGGLLLLAVAPLLLLIAAWIKLDSPGRVFFVQRRYGFNNQLIGVWKFRTMHVKDQDDDAVRLTTRSDPRVTRAGAWLRRTSLDELPQLFNVIKGEMSLVGPRPHALKATAGGRPYEEAVAHYAARHRVKPGITGWAQVNGWRGATSTEEQLSNRVQHDLYYIENWSLMLDLKILALTLVAVLAARNSY